MRISPAKRAIWLCAAAAKSRWRSANTTVAAAVLDRLLHRAIMVHIDGESYRLRAHRETLKGLREGAAGGGEIP